MWTRCCCPWSMQPMACRLVTHSWALDGLLPVLVAQIRDMLLTEKRKAAFAERMGGEFKYDDLVALVRPDAGARSFRGLAGYEWACIALIEAFSSKASVPVDIYVSADGAVQRFRVCEEGKVEDEKALRLAYVQGGWCRPLPSTLPEPSTTIVRRPSASSDQAESAVVKGEEPKPKRARKGAPKAGSSAGGGKARAAAGKAALRDMVDLTADDEPSGVSMICKGTSAWHETCYFQLHIDHVVLIGRD